MRRVVPSSSWPESWKTSYTYDLLEVYGHGHDPGYAIAYRNRRDVALALMTEVLPRGATVLDLAAAQGNFSIALAELGYEVTWNDLRAELADYVRLKHDRGSIRYAPGNAFDLEFDTPFDAVLIAEVIEHVAHPDHFLAKVGELVRPGGYIVMTSPNGAYFRNPLPKFSECEDPSVFESVQFGPNSDAHIFLLHEHEVRELAARAGLETETVLLFNNPLSHGYMKLHRVLHHLPRAAVDRVEARTRALPHPISQRLHTHLAARFRVVEHR